MHENISILFNINFYIHKIEVVLGGGTKCHFVPRRFFSQDAPRSGHFFEDLFILGGGELQMTAVAFVHNP